VERCALDSLNRLSPFELRTTLISLASSNTMAPRRRFFRLGDFAVEERENTDAMAPAERAMATGAERNASLVG
jgi:hypothetical protein